MLYKTQVLYGTQNVVRHDLSSNFCGDQSDFITKILHAEFTKALCPFFKF